MCYNDFIASAQFFRLPAVALAEESASCSMGSRQAVLLTPPESSSATWLHPAPATPLESALIEVFILKSFKFFRMNTYEKHRGEGAFLFRNSPLATRHSSLATCC
jgi:hypothetical protein